MKLVTRLRLKYIVADYLSVNLAWAMFNVTRFFTLPYNYMTMELPDYYRLPAIQLGQLIFPFMMLCLYAVSGFYNQVIGKSRTSEFLNTFGVSFIGTVIIFFTTLYNDNIDDRMHNVEMIFLLWMLLSLFAYLPRVFITNDIMAKVRSHKISYNALIVGASDKAAAMYRNLDTLYPKMGFNVKGFVSISPDEQIHSTLPADVPVIDFAKLATAVRDFDIQALILVPDSKTKNRSVELLNSLFPLNRSIFITPDIMQFITYRPRTSTIAGEVLIDVGRSKVPASTLNIKRICDVVLSLLALIILSPLLAVIAIMVKRDSKGPVIYKQVRLGRNKRKFKIYKFRSMYLDSEANGPSLSSENDPRITPVGRVLRKYRLDELPQFWNVVKGDMSLVGPRPEREYYLDQVIAKAPYYSLLNQVRPGITSWGMVKFGYAKNVDQMIERYKYDLLYLDNLSLAVDLKILIYTIRTVITGKGV